MWCWCIKFDYRTQWDSQSKLCLCDFMVMELKLVVTWINFHQVQGPVMDDGNKNANKPKCLNSGMQHFELYSMVSVLGTQSNSKDSRFLPLGCIRESEIPVINGCAALQQRSPQHPRICVRSTVFTDNKCHETILQWIAWSFTAMCALFQTCHGEFQNISKHDELKFLMCAAFSLGSGYWPNCDPWGREFTHSYMPKWWQRAGTPLAGGWKAAFDGCQADQEWLHRVFKLQRLLDVNLRVLRQN